MPLYVIERTYAERVEPYLGAFEKLNEINANEGVRWLYSFLSLDHRKSYCLYEAPTAELILSAAAAAGIPADRVVEVAGRILPSGALEPVV
ncbi:nickel-binding protein [Promicromonospora sp. NPDC050262]|uniref:nickel-binding protein n=1 Tax=Promicromonospora sp. NPDC050262 TaxID=3155036 RepID=UPI00340CC095